LKKIAILGQPPGLLLIPYGHFEKLPFHLKTLIFQVPYTINRIKMPKDKREMERIGSCNLSHFSSNDDTTSQQGMGRTLNLSQSGIFLEASYPIELKKSIFGNWYRRRSD